MSEIITLDLFERLYREALALVEETIEYLSNQGRRDRSELSIDLTLVYAAESMRMTTQLMQCVAWLMVQRAVRNGEITAEDAADPRHRLGGHPICQGDRTAGAPLLPERLKYLMNRAAGLYERVDRLDRFLHDAEVEPKRPGAPHPPEMTEDAHIVSFGAETLSVLKAERARLRRSLRLI